MIFLLNIFLSSTSQGLLWSLLAIGVFLTYRILDIADLTTEGSFPLGGAVAAFTMVRIREGFETDTLLYKLQKVLVPILDIHPAAPSVFALIFAFIAGALAGLTSGFLHTKLKIPALLAGIITMTGLYSINARVMGAPNISLLGTETIFTQAQNWGLEKTISVIVVGVLVVAVVIGLLTLFFKTEAGLATRATGDNIEMSQANGINTDGMKMIGYMLSNGCIALAGALLVQNNNFADLNSGIGTIVIGAVLYRFILACVLELNVDPTDLKLFSAFILVICLSSPLVQKKLKLSKKGGTR
ncbi:ABC transporter permease [Enterococcus sp. LJL51]|uniref:ABC transporter permease n=1 Tax=Enterococcus sp. LJL51 TaxID=3416656 RepID=UPI003CF6E36E